MWDSLNKKENQCEHKFQTICSSVDKCFRLRLLFKWIFFFSIEPNIYEFHYLKKKINPNINFQILCFSVDKCFRLRLLFEWIFCFFYWILTYVRFNKYKRKTMRTWFPNTLFFRWQVFPSKTSVQMNFLLFYWN